MGIINFQGEREDQKKKFNGPISVRDHMTTKLVTLKPDQSLIEVINLFMENKITGAPVVDVAGRLVGIISDSDCMKQISEGRYFNMPIANMRVADYMTKEVQTIDPDKTIFDAAAEFFKTHHRRFPVIEDGELIGQISRKDVMLAALKMSSQNWY